MHGLSSKVKIMRVATKFDRKFQMKIDALAEKIEIIGDYTMDGQILVLPIKGNFLFVQQGLFIFFKFFKGNGKANITMENAKVLVIIKGEYLEKNGEIFIEIKNFSISFTPKHAVFKFTNIFKGDKALSDNINVFMNENWQVVSDLLIPSYAEKLGEQFKAYSQKVFAKVPVKNIFKE